MKELFFEMFKGLLLSMCFVLFCFVIASLSRSAYAVDLSKSTSVTPQRHCGFIAPKFCKASQAAQKTSASVSATHTRLQSLYEGQTRQNKSAMANMLGGSSRPRVMPLTSLLIGETSQNSKLLGGNSHA
ncbi:hypothetical protein MXL26_01190 [Acinetobacter towneri]|uniref:hypothetical protein n=1 Tax=Acinetobacter towneri TaxID=202956 RepID=UPI002DBA5C21|nr:hypothetical protein [Acinetobacter towneri]MEB6564008.1 hypothetical protein [Acinetobacter towneri]